MYFLAGIGDHLLILGLIIVLISWQKRLLSGVQVTFVLAMTLFSWVLGYLIKIFFYFPRPYVMSGQISLAGDLLDGSFPSNHAIFSLTLAFAAYIFNRKLGLLLFLLALLVSYSRIIAHVHSPADVAGAALLSGLVVALGRKFIYPRLVG